MGKFLTEDEPLGRYLEDGVRFMLADSVIYMPYEDSEDYIEAEAGFITDWASIPQLLHGVLSQKWGRRPAVIHDKLYDTMGENGKYSRQECDSIFLDAMKSIGVPFIVRQTMFLGVRFGGWIVWSNKAQQHDKYEDE